VIVAATKAGSYEERTCSRCFEGRVYDIERGTWLACERCSGGGLPLPQAKSPSTVAQRVIHYFGPEPWQWGSGSFALQVGVGRRNERLHRLACTPSRKIRAQFHGCEHTLLNVIVVTFYDLRFYGVLGSPYPASCIAAVHYPLIGARLYATHRLVCMVNNT
jgi:hypothetical protein